MGKKAKTMGKPGSPAGKPVQKAAAVPSPGAALGAKIKKPQEKPATPKQKDQAKKEIVKVLSQTKENTPVKQTAIQQINGGGGGKNKKKNKQKQGQQNGIQVQPAVPAKKIADDLKKKIAQVPSGKPKPTQAVKRPAEQNEPKAKKQKAAKKAQKGGKAVNGAPKKDTQNDSIIIADDVSESEDEEAVVNKHSYVYEQDIQRIKAQAKVTVQAVLKLIQQKKEKDLLFRDAPTRIMMDYFSFKQPEVRSKCITVTMPHSIYQDDPDFLLIIQDDKKNSEDFVEPEFKAADFKKKLLEEHGVKIREVLTMKQIATEYNTYELKEKLIRSVDAIFVQRSIRKYIPALFGKQLYKQKRYLIPVNFAGERNPGEELKKAFKKVIIPIPIHGNHGVAIVGSEQLTEEHLIDNISQVCWKLSKVYPGGWENIARIYLSLPYNNIPRIPLYFALGYWNEVKEMLPLRKPDEDYVEDELTTAAGDRKIRVYADGRIEFVGKDSDDDDEDDSDLEFVDDEDEEFEDDPAEDPEAEQADDGSSDDE